MSFIALGREQIVSVYTQDINVVPVAMYLLWFAMAYHQWMPYKLALPAV